MENSLSLTQISHILGCNFHFRGKKRTLILLRISELDFKVQMWELDHKEGQVPKNWCFQTVVPEKTLECPLEVKEIKQINPKGNQPWILIGRTDVEAPTLRPPDVESWLIGKDPDARKDWGPEEKGTKEDEMVGWHHWLNGHEFEQTPGLGEGQGSLVCCSPWDHKESDTTEQLNSLSSNFPPKG